MPMIDVTATEGTFANPQALARAVAAAVMSIEQVPDIPMFRQNTAGFVHEIPAGMLADVDGSDAHVRVQVLTNAGALDRDKQLAVVAELTRLVAEAAGELLARWETRTARKPLTWERRTLAVRERPEARPRIRQRSKAAATTISSKVAKATS